MSNRLPPTREQLLAMMARSSWEQKVALCVIILLNRDWRRIRIIVRLPLTFCNRRVAC